MPLLRAGSPDNPNVTGGPSKGWGFSLPTVRGDLGGASWWMMDWVAQNANVTINFDVVRLPGAVYYGTSKNDTAARSIYLLDTMGYDCVVGTVFIQPQRMNFMRCARPPALRACVAPARVILKRPRCLRFACHVCRRHQPSAVRI